MIYKLLFFFLIALSSCKIYKRDLLFRAEKEKELEFLEQSKNIVTPTNYQIYKNDLVAFQLFTNKGEIMIDPTSEFAKQTSSSGGSSTATATYLVQNDGTVNLPIIGKVKIDSITIHQCDSLLAQLYSKYYLDPYVKTKISNRRIYIVGIGAGGLGGASSGGGKVMDLEHENTNLLEVISKIGGPSAYSYMNRVKIIRGDLKNPKIFTIDFTKWNSFQSSNLIIQPNDIIYIEPARRPVFDYLRDISFIAQLSTIAFTLILFFRL
jgi:polysaccharide export outer membrane protein